jgi:hypothetical protein
MTVAKLVRAEEILGHPMKRATDPLLAHAVLAPKIVPAAARTESFSPVEAQRTSGMGRLPSIGRPDQSLTEGLGGRVAWQKRAIAFLRRAAGIETPPPVITSRKWQLNQGQTPQCVAYTVTHWRMTLPVYTPLRSTLTPAEFYMLCKQRDGWPDADGTTAQAALAVAQEHGDVESHWWWQGASDDDAARTWLQTKGSMWYGVFVPESFFRTSREVEGLIEINGPLLYGHEMLAIGWTKSYKGQGPCFQILNSWGDIWGVRGRGFIREADFYRMLYEGGDLVGVQEKRA